jgi:hypothetical protein
MFKVIEKLNNFTPAKQNTMHYNDDRLARTALCNKLIEVEKAKVIACYAVDKNHPNGYEVHEVYNNGVVIIYNLNSGKKITELIARENQILRYGLKPSKCMLKKCRQHENKGFNN